MREGDCGALKEQIYSKDLERLGRDLLMSLKLLGLQLPNPNILKSSRTYRKNLGSMTKLKLILNYAAPTCLMGEE